MLNIYLNAKSEDLKQTYESYVEFKGSFTEAISFIEKITKEIEEYNVTRGDQEREKDGTCVL